MNTTTKQILRHSYLDASPFIYHPSYINSSQISPNHAQIWWVSWRVQWLSVTKCTKGLNNLISKSSEQNAKFITVMAICERSVLVSEWCSVIKFTFMPSAPTHLPLTLDSPVFFDFSPLKIWFTWNLWYCRLRKDSPRPRSGLSLHDHDRPLSRVSEGQGVREQARRASEAGALSPLHPTLHCVSLKFAFSGALLAVMTSFRAFAELSPNDVLRGAGARAV